MATTVFKSVNVPDAARASGVLRAGEKMLVAVSGGPDSMALLHALLDLREELGLAVVVAHLDHCLRGDASRRDAEFVAAEARRLGLPFRVGRSDVGALRRQTGGSLEMAARRARYEFLARTAEVVGADAVATGHTADDQVETMIMGLLRGGGIAALRGIVAERPIRPGSPVRVVRPLLGVRRSDVLAFLSERGVPYRTDATNADTSFLRNWVRHEFLPVLEARWPGSLRAKLMQLAGRAADLWQALDAQAEALVRAERGKATVAVRALASAPGLLRAEVFRRAFARAGGRGELTRRTTRALEGLLAGASGRQVSLPGGLVARRDYEVLTFGRAEAAPRLEARLRVPGRVELPAFGLWLEAETCEPSEATFSQSRWEEVADLDAAGEELTLRTRRRGDRFVPLGLGRAKKLKDFFIDQRVPRAERDRTVVVCGREGIVWVVGLRLDERARLRTGSRRALRLRAGPLPAREGPGVSQ